MKQTLKRIIVAILGVALLFSTVALTASCKKCEDNPSPTQPPYTDNSSVTLGELVYQLVDDDYTDVGTPTYYTVIGVIGSDANKIVIPTEAYGKPVKAIAADAFYGNANIESIEIPSTVTKIGERALAACASLESIEVAADNEAFKSVDGSLYTKDGSVLVQYAIGKGNSYFSLPDGVSEIGAYALANARISSLTLCDSLTAIGEFALMDSDVKTVDIPASVNSIAGSAFDYCTSLTAINVSSANATYKSVDGNLYTKANVTLVRYAIGKSGKSFSVASDTLVIGDYAFSGATLLESISLPASLTTIGEFAFLNCESLKSLAITKDVSSIAPSAFDNCYKLASFTVNEQNNDFSAASGVLMTYDAKTIVKYPPAKSDTKYDLPSNVTAIDTLAFADAVNLKKLLLTTNVEYIGVDAFDGCKVLDFNTSGGVNYLGNTSNQFYALVSLSASSNNTVKSVETRSSTALIAGGAFKGSKALEKVTLSSSVKYVCDDAFSYCTSLKSIDFKNTVKIHSGALSHCLSLDSIVFSDTVRLLEENAIIDCPAIKSVFYKVASSEEWEQLKSADNPLDEGKQDSPTYNNAIRYYYSASEPAFHGNYWRYASGQPAIWTTMGEIVESEGLEFTLNASGSHYIVSGIGSFTGSDVVIPAKHEGKPVKEIGGGAFVNNSKIVSVVIPYSVESIGANAFTDCSRLESISIPDSLSFIGDCAFKNCNKIESVYIPNGVTAIEEETFLGCASLKSVTLSDNISIIKANAFSGCTALLGISLPYGALSIQDNAFYGCTKLTDVSLPETLSEIGSGAFAFSGIKTIEIPASVLWISDSAFRGCASLQEINIHEDNAVYTSFNGILYREEDGNAVALICCPEGYIYPKKTPNDKSAEITITVPDTVTSIAANALNGCNVRSVEFGSGIETIGDYAFEGCAALAVVRLPASVKSIGKYAFEGLDITELSIADGATVVICEGAFKDCARLTTVTLPEGTASIARHAFYGCKNLMSLTIPDSVTEIGIFAFYGCEKLATVTVGNGVTKLNGGVFSDCKALLSITIGAGVIEIADSAFDGCLELTKIKVADGSTAYKSVGGVLYTADEKTLVRYPAGKAEAFVIPDGVTAVANHAFLGSSVTSVVIPDTVTAVGDSAFYVCSSLASVTVGAGVETIGKSAFANCASLDSVEFVDGTVALTIGDEAFSDCNSLKAIEIPDRATELGVGAFQNCHLLEVAILGEGITEIKQDTFSGDDNLESIVLSTGFTAIGKNAFLYCVDLAKICYLGARGSYTELEVESGNSAFTSASRYYYSELDPNTYNIHWHYANGNIEIWQ